MPALDLEPRLLRVVREILRTHVHGIEVLAFGSRVSGKARKFSDLDLALLNHTPLAEEQRRRLEEAFAESDLPIKVDVVEWPTTPESLRRRIQAANVVMQSATE